ncbi:MAG: DUF2490 domain-containing protein [Ferruginibacter sp.]|nr:DUF2490 domain-containing protein [Ferruginibacter sp.]
MKNLLLLFCFFSFGKSYTKAQIKQTTQINRVWLGFFNQTRLSDRWGIWADAHLRTEKNFIEDFSQAFIRVGLTRYLDDHTKITAGYAFVNEFPSENHPSFSRYEHRPWQQIQWHTNYGKKKMMQWIRTEQRYRRKILGDSSGFAPGYNFNHRIRYNIYFDVPLNKAGVVPKSFSWIINNEVHINFGKEIINNYFDQNRFFTGIKYQINTHDNLQLGYMNLFQQLPAGNKYRDFHVIRLFYFQNLDLRKKR